MQHCNQEQKEPHNTLNLGTMYSGYRVLKDFRYSNLAFLYEVCILSKTYIYA